MWFLSESLTASALGGLKPASVSRLRAASLIFCAVTHTFKLY